MPDMRADTQNIPVVFFAKDSLLLKQEADILLSKRTENVSCWEI